MSMAFASWIAGKDAAPLLAGLDLPGRFSAAGGWHLWTGALCFFPDQKEDPETPRLPDPRRTALVGLLVTLLIVVLCVLLIRALGRTAQLQDCVMSGRTDCAPIDVPTSR